MLRAVVNSGVTNLVIGGSTITGGATTQVLFNSGGFVSSSANLTFTDTLINSGPGMKVGTSNGTSAGWYIGYVSSGLSGLYPTSVTPSGVGNAAVYSNGAYLALSSPSASDIVYIQNGGNAKATFSGIAGAGLGITAGIAATNAPRALSVSQTWTDGTSSNIGIVGNFDMGATGTATGDLLQLNAGPDATTKAFAVSNLGGLSLGSAILIRNMVSFASAGAAQVGTLTNSPSAGNPAKFLFIIDNGQTLAIPAWSVP